MHNGAGPLCPRDALSAIVILGATSAIARAVITELAKKGERHFVFVARDRYELSRVAADARIRFGLSVSEVVADIVRADTLAGAAREILEASGGRPAGIVLLVGLLGDQRYAEEQAGHLRRILEVNFIGPVVLTQPLIEAMATTGSGWMAAVSSVAAARGRRSNYAYGAAKAGLETWAFGLRHRFGRTAIRIVVLRAGPVDTAMSYGFYATLVGTPTTVVARALHKQLRRNRALSYVPGRWRLIMALIRLLPEVIFNRLRL